MRQPPPEAHGSLAIAPSPPRPHPGFAALLLLACLALLVLLVPPRLAAAQDMPFAGLPESIDLAEVAARNAPPLGPAPAYEFEAEAGQNFDAWYGDSAGRSAGADVAYREGRAASSNLYEWPVDFDPQTLDEAERLMRRIVLENRDREPLQYGFVDPIQQDRPQAQQPQRQQAQPRQQARRAQPPRRSARQAAPQGRRTPGAQQARAVGPVTIEGEVIDMRRFRTDRERPQSVLLRVRSSDGLIRHAYFGDAQTAMQPLPRINDGDYVTIYGNMDTLSDRRVFRAEEILMEGGANARAAGSRRFDADDPRVEGIVERLRVVTFDNNRPEALIARVVTEQDHADVLIGPESSIEAAEPRIHPGDRVVLSGYSRVMDGRRIFLVRNIRDVIHPATE